MFTRLRALVRKFAPSADSEGGQGLVEYALILAFVALACVIALTSLGTAISGPISDTTASL